MNVIFLSSLFVLANSEILKDDRNSSRPSFSEITQIISQISGTEFYATLKIPSDALSAGKTTVRDFMDDVHSKLEQLTLKLSDSLHNYVYKKLELYFLYAIELVEKSKNIENFQKEVVNKISFESKDLCVASFLFNLNNDADLGFHAMYFLQSLSNKCTLDYNILLTKLKSIHERLKNCIVTTCSIDAECNILQLTKLSEDQSAKSSRELLTLMTEMKKNIMEVSEKFCSSSIRPIIFKDVFVENQDKNMLHPFINYVYNDERCQITFYEDFAQQESFFAYFCSSIRNSPEYGVEDYMDHVMANEETRTSMLRKKSRWGMRDMTLNTLKLKINKNNYYFDFVKYSNASSDILLSILIKEGIKILKCVNDFLKRYCHENSMLTTITDVHAIRTQLYIFYFFFTEFISRTFEYIPLLNQHYLLNPFKTDVKSILSTFMIPMESVDDFNIYLCEHIPQFTLRIPLTAIHGEKPVKVYFDEYYLTSPILNIHKTLVNLNMMFFEYV